MLTCRSCTSASLELVLDLGRQPWGNDFRPLATAGACPLYPLQLLFCHSCGTAQIGYTIPKETMFVDHSYLSGTTRSLRAHFAEIGKKIIDKNIVERDGYCLDIGGNDGTFLTFLRDRGISVLNVDSGVKQARISEANGIPCLNRFFNRETAAEILRQKGPAAAIHGAGVLFHLEELHSAFEGIKSLLHPSGALIAEFIYLPDMIQRTAFDQIYHEHLLYYTLRTFETVLKRHGMALVDAETAPIHGGTCIAYAAHANRGEPSARLQSMLDRERTQGFDRVDTYRRFADACHDVRRRLRAMIGELKAQGRRIHLLGAPVKGTTILHFCGFDENDFACAEEVNDLKVGTYYPGTRIPVVKEGTKPEPDVYVLLSWNFADEILPKFDDFRRRGGRILVPIPKPRLI